MDINNISNQQQIVQPQVQPQMVQPQVTSQPQVQQVAPTQPMQSTFTQEQVNAIVSSRVNEVNTKFSNQAQELTNIQAQLAQATSELTKYKHAEVLRNNNVNPAFNDFVEFSASKLAVNGKTYEQAVVEFISQNPQYLQTMVSPSPAPQNVVQQASQTVGEQVVTGQQVVQPQPQVVPQQTVPVVNLGNTGINVSTQQQSGVVDTEQAKINSILELRGYKLR